MYILHNGMKNGLCLLWATLGAMCATAQQHQEPYWVIEHFANKDIVGIRWEYAGMARTENISNAVVLQVTHRDTLRPGKLLVKGAQGNEVRMHSGGLHLTVGGNRLQILGGFDSTQHRGLRIQDAAQGYWMGGGTRSTPLLRNGQRISLYNAPAYGYGENQDQLNFSVPFVIHSSGLGLFFDNPSKGYIDFGANRPQVLEAAFASGPVQLYVVGGGTPLRVLAGYSLLTGRQPLPPRWALGNLVSRFGYLSAQQVDSVVRQMKEAGFPMDGLIVDLFWFGKTIQETLGNLDWDRDNWPEPEKMIARLRKDDINTILITEPFVLENTLTYPAALPHLATDSAGNPYRLTEFYFGKGGIINLFRKDAQSWFWQYYRRQNQLGVAGWWGDLGEPEHHPAAVHYDMTDLGIGRKMSAHEVHNIYGHYWSQMVHQNWQQDHPEKRLFFLNRAGYAGSQRYSIFPWTGDVGRSWSGLRGQIPALQSMSVSGIPYIHSDAGGFAMTDTADAELYLRWLQFATYTPILRPHGSALGPLTPEGTISLPSEPVFWDAQTRRRSLNAITERYRLLPYLYTMAWQHTTQGLPLIRPLPLLYPMDSLLHKATDQYMWGDHLLVAPLLQPGARNRKVQLPPGIWYRPQNLTWERGNRSITELASFEQIPTFIKGGSVIPYWDTSGMRSTRNFSPSSTITFRYYPAQDSLTSWWYDDDGHTPYAETRDALHQTIRFHSALAGEEVILTGTYGGNLLQGKSRKAVLQIARSAIFNTLSGKPTDYLKLQLFADGKLINTLQLHIPNTSGQYIGLPFVIQNSKGFELRISRHSQIPSASK